MNTINRLPRIFQSVLLLIFTLLVSSTTAEEKPAAPWLQKDVLQAALNIDMDTEQSPKFKVAITRYFNDLNSGIKKLIRRNPPGLKREIKRKKNSVRKHMDQDMAKFLNDEQMTKYHIYRDLLLAKLNGAPIKSGPVTLQDAPTSHTY